MGFSCVIEVDEYHDLKCTIPDRECMYLFPNSKQCAKDYGEGPDYNYKFVIIDNNDELETNDKK